MRLRPVQHAKPSWRRTLTGSYGRSARLARGSLTSTSLSHTRQVDHRMICGPVAMCMTGSCLARTCVIASTAFLPSFGNFQSWQLPDGHLNLGYLREWHLQAVTCDSYAVLATLHDRLQPGQLQQHQAPPHICTLAAHRRTLSMRRPPPAWLL